MANDTIEILAAISQHKLLLQLILWQNNTFPILVGNFSGKRANPWISYWQRGRTEVTVLFIYLIRF